MVSKPVSPRILSVIAWSTFALIKNTDKDEEAMVLRASKPVLNARSSLVKQRRYCETSMRNHACKEKQLKCDYFKAPRMREAKHYSLKASPSRVTIRPSVNTIACMSCRIARLTGHMAQAVFERTCPVTERREVRQSRRGPHTSATGTTGVQSTRGHANGCTQTKPNQEKKERRCGGSLREDPHTRLPQTCRPD